MFSDCYETYDKKGKLDDFNQLPEELKVDAEDVLLNFGNGRLIPAKYWKTIVIFSDLFINDLL